MKRIRWAWLAALIPPACLLVMVWKFERMMAGPRLDHALIAAIQRDNAPETLRLLEDGANPNASDAPPPPSLWQWLIQRWRSKTLPPSDDKTAMQIAFARAVPDIYEERPPYEARLRIVAALHQRGAEDWPDPLAHKHNSEEIGLGCGPSMQQTVSDLFRLQQRGFRMRDPNVLRTVGASADYLVVSAQYHQCYGDMDGAMCLCRLAQIRQPNNTEIVPLLGTIERQARLIPLNAALIAAVRRDDTAGVSAALARGADANARDVPAWPETRKWLLQTIPDRNDSPAVYPSALKIAVYRDMIPFGEEGALCDYEPDLPKQSRFAIIKALHDAGAKPAADLTGREKSLPEPNALATTASRFPGKPLCIYTNARQALDFADFLKANGMSARAYSELAKGCANLTLCEWAVHASRIARLWNPDAANLAEAARNAEEVLRLRRAIQRTLPAECQVFRVLPYPNAGKMKRWAVLYRGKASGLESGYYCAVCGENAGHFTLLFRGKEGVSGERGRLFVAPLTGRRLPEIIGYAEDEMAGAAPAKMIAYALEGGHWNLVLDVGSNQGVWLERLRHERAYVVRNGYETGNVMCHANQPRRLDIYAYNGKEYTFADPKYPEEFREYIKEAEDTLRIYPNDTDLPYHLACCYTFTGQKRKAERYWRKAGYGPGKAHPLEPTNRY